MPSSSGLLVNDSEDINEFCQYLFNTCSNDFVDLFKILYTVPLESDSSCPFYNNYFNIQFFKKNLTLFYYSGYYSRINKYNINEYTLIMKKSIFNG